MATIPVEITLYEKMNTFFRGYDFLLMTDKKQFRRVTPTGFQNVIFTTTEYNNETWLEVNLGCRNEQIEQIAQQFLGNTRDYWEDANTLVISIGKFNNTNYFRYKILSEQDLEDTCEEIKLFLTEQGFPFLNKYDHLEAIHQLFNKLPHQSCKYLYNQVHRCFKGAICGKLINSGDFMSIAEKYRKILHRIGATPEELITYERMLGFLVYISVN